MQNHITSGIMGSQGDNDDPIQGTTQAPTIASKFLEGDAMSQDIWFWHFLVEAQFQCIAATVVDLFKGLMSKSDSDTDRIQNDFFDILVMQASVREDGIPRVENWDVDYSNYGGVFIRLTDGSIVHFQGVQNGFSLQAWYFADVMRGRRPGKTLTRVFVQGGNIDVVKRILQERIHAKFTQAVNPGQANGEALNGPAGIMSSGIA